MILRVQTKGYKFSGISANTIYYQQNIDPVSEYFLWHKIPAKTNDEIKGDKSETIRDYGGNL